MELQDAIFDIMEGDCSHLGVNYDTALEYAMKDARFIELCHELHGATSTTELFQVKGDYCNLMREKIGFLLEKAEEEKLTEAL